MDSGTKRGTISGTLLTIVATINMDDVFKTAILAAIGAVVSFAVSISMKQMVKWWKL
jgi:hypothetical protein